MEHHTYAKSRDNKMKTKWTLELKRELVKKRTEAGFIFKGNSPKNTGNWHLFQGLMNVAQGIFKPEELRAQWMNMLRRYRKQKATVTGPLDEEAIKKENEKWEFFGAIHAHIQQQSTEMHSYAQRAEAEATTQAKTNSAEAAQAKQASTSRNDNEIVRIEDEEEPEHEPEGDSDESHDEIYFHEILLPKPPANGSLNPGYVAIPASCYHDLYKSHIRLATLNRSDNQKDDIKARKAHRKSEKEKYYKHRRRHDLRVEQYLQGICNNFNAVLKHLAPGVKLEDVAMTPSEEQSAENGSHEDPQITIIDED